MNKTEQSSFGKSTSQNQYEGRVGLVYCRVSSKRQEIEGSGLQSQEGRCIDDLKRISVVYHRSFSDSFTGGGDFMRRPAMRAMLEYIDATPHKKFVVIFDDTAEGEFVETVVAAGGALERKQNQRQVIQKQRARLEAGYWAFGSKK